MPALMAFEPDDQRDVQQVCRTFASHLVDEALEIPAKRMGF